MLNHPVPCPQRQTSTELPHGKNDDVHPTKAHLHRSLKRSRITNKTKFANTIKYQSRHLFQDQLPIIDGRRATWSKNSCPWRTCDVRGSTKCTPFVSDEMTGDLLPAIESRRKNISTRNSTLLKRFHELNISTGMGSNQLGLDEVGVNKGGADNQDVRMCLVAKELHAWPVHIDTLAGTIPYQ